MADRLSFPVVDADGHVVEGQELFDHYLAPAFRHQAPRLVQDAGGGRRMLYEDRVWPPFPVGENSSWLPPDSPSERLKLLDQERIAAMVLFPSKATFFPAGEDAALALALVQAYNRYLADYCRAAPDRLIGVGLVALHDPAAGAAEARRAIELGMRALLVRPNPVCGRRLDDPAYLPFYATVEELGVPLIVHETTGVVPTAGADRWGLDRPDAYAFTHLISHPFEQMLAAASLIGGGVLERFPRLRVGFFESGCGWLPYWLWRLDEHWEQPTLRPQFGKLTMRPSDYFARQCWTTCEPDEANLAATISVLGESKVMFASDLPHYDSHRGVVGEFWRDQPLLAAMKRRLLSDNAAAFYGLDLARLAKVRAARPAKKTPLTA